MKVLQTPYRAQRANAMCKRFLGSVRRVCPDHLLMFGERQLYQVIGEYVRYFNWARPHQELEQRIPEGLRSEETKPRTREVIAFPVLNGLHHDYRRAA